MVEVDLEDRMVVDRSFASALDRERGAGQADERMEVDRAAEAVSSEGADREMVEEDQLGERTWGVVGAKACEGDGCECRYERDEGVEQVERS